MLAVSFTKCRKHDGEMKCCGGALRVEIAILVVCARCLAITCEPLFHHDCISFDKRRILRARLVTRAAESERRVPGQLW